MACTVGSGPGRPSEGGSALMAVGALGLCCQGRNLAITVGFCFVRDSLNLYISWPPHFKTALCVQTATELSSGIWRESVGSLSCMEYGKVGIHSGKAKWTAKQFWGWEAHEPPAPLPGSPPSWGVGSTRTWGVQVHKMAALKQRGTGTSSRVVSASGGWGLCPILPSWPCVSGLPCRALLPALTSGRPLRISVSEELPSSSHQILEGNHHRS